MGENSTFVVNFIDDVTGDVIQTLNINSGSNAPEPELPMHVGFEFSGYSDSLENITEDKDIRVLFANTNAVNNDVVDRFIKIGKEYVEQNAFLSSQKKLWNEFEEKKFKVITPPKHISLARVIFEANRHNVPFQQSVDGKFMIRPEDTKKFTKIIDSIHVDATRYAKESTIVDLIQGIMIDPKKDNKNVLSFGNLSVYEAEILKKKCNRIRPGLLIGTGKSVSLFDQTTIAHEFTIEGKYILASNPKNMDFCKAYLEMCLELYGKVSSDVVNQLDNERQFNEVMDMLQNSKEPYNYYVIDSNDIINKFYVKLTPTEVVHGCASKNAVISSTSCYEDEYKGQVDALLDEIPNKVILTEEEFKDWCSVPPEKEMFSKKAVSNATKTLKYRFAIKELARIIDTAIKNNIKEKNMKISNPEDRFNYYQQEAEKIMAACTIQDLAKAKAILKDYPPEVLDKIASVKEKRGIEDWMLSPVIEMYGNVTKEYVNIDDELQKAGVDKTQIAAINK